jgi:hypothetical protein
MGAANDERLVRVAADERAQYLVAYTRQRDRPVLRTRPRRENRYPGRVAVTVGCARALRMGMVFRATAGKADLDPAQRITINLLVHRPDHGCVLDLGAGQVDTRVICGHDRNAASNAGKTVGVAHAALGAGLVERALALAPVVEREQAPYPFIECLRKIVAGLDLQFGDDEVALGFGMLVKFRMACDPVPLTDAHGANAPFTLKEFGCVFQVLDARYCQVAVVVGVVARMRGIDQIVVQAGTNLATKYPLIAQ